jgi:hypothetical protein
MNTYTCLLADGTVGTLTTQIPADAYMKEGLMALIGKSMTVQLNDENGCPIEKQGVIVEVLEEIKLENKMKIYTDERSENPLDFCNTCQCMFADSNNKEYGELPRQSSVNRGWLATKVDGEVVQECCEHCASEIAREGE